MELMTFMNLLWAMLECDRNTSASYSWKLHICKAECMCRKKKKRLTKSNIICQKKKLLKSFNYVQENIQKEHNRYKFTLGFLSYQSFSL